MRFLLLLIVLGITNSKLIQVAEVFRHGSRYVIKDGFTNSGELLPTGMRQHYNLGKMLRKEYIEDQPFLSQQFNHDEINVRSTDVNRTLQSVQSQILGLYPNGPQIPDIEQIYLLPPYKNVSDYVGSKYALPNGRQVIPVHVEPDHYQVLLPNCVSENQLSQNDINSFTELSQQFEDATKQQRQDLCKKFQMSSCDGSEDLGGFYTDYMSAIFEGREVPIISKEEQLILSRFKAFSMLRDSAGPQMSKYLAQPFYVEVLKMFKDKISNPEIPLKFQIYSAHDTNVIRYAAVLGLINADCLIKQAKSYDPNLQCQHAPDFAASMIFELHQNDADSKYFIKVKYNGEYQRICDGTFECPYNVFEARVQKEIATEEEFVRVCGENPYRNAEDGAITTYIMYVQSIVILALVLSAIKFM